MPPRRDPGEKAALDALPLLLHLQVEGLLEILRAGREPLLAEAAVYLGGHLVHSELDDGDVRRAGFEVRRESKARHLELGRLQILEAPPEVDEHQVALVAQQGHGRGCAFGGARGGGEHLGGLVGGLGPGGRRQGPPLVPAQAEHLVEDAPPFEGLGDTRVVHLAHLLTWIPFCRLAFGHRPQAT